MTSNDTQHATSRAEDESLWRFASATGMDRREFLRLLIVGSTAAVIAACSGSLFSGDVADTTPTVDPTSPPWFKDPTPFIQRGPAGLETRLENLNGMITPARQFFVRNNGKSSIDVDVSGWRLAVEGDAIAEPVQLSIEELQRLPSQTMISYLECAGNHRSMFNELQGRESEGTQWGRGAIGNGEWVGVSLRDVLTLAGVTAAAVSVLLVGLDTEAPENGFRYVLPVEKAMDSDTLLAYSLNGEPLPKDHGFPLRAIVPGWVGSSHIKWLGRIVVSSEKLWTRNNTTSYVLIGEDYPPEGEARGKPVTMQSIKSALALAWPAQLSVGAHRIHGYAHSPSGTISRVEWSVDSGRTWRNAELTTPQPDHSWVQFEFTWDAEAGEHTIMTRATDSAGNTQPDHVPFNEKGYLFNQPLPHPIWVV